MWHKLLVLVMAVAFKSWGFFWFNCDFGIDFLRSTDILIFENFVIYPRFLPWRSCLGVSPLGRFLTVIKINVVLVDLISSQHIWEYHSGFPEDILCLPPRAFFFKFWAHSHPSGHLLDRSDEVPHICQSRSLSRHSQNGWISTRSAQYDSFFFDLR